MESVIGSSPVLQETWQFSHDQTRLDYFTLTMEAGATASRFEFASAGKADFALTITPDTKGAVINVAVQRLDGESGKWEQVEQGTLVFLRELKDGSGEGSSWQGRALSGVLRTEAGETALWLEGRLLAVLPGFPKGSAVLKPGKNVVLHRGAEAEIVSDARLLPIDLSALLPGEAGVRQQQVVEGIPFSLRKGNALSLAEAGWPQWKDDPGSFYEDYDAGPAFIGDRRIPLVQIPRHDYTAAHVLAWASSDDATTSWLTLRAGRRIGGAGRESQVFYRDFGGEIPRGKAGEWRYVRIPFSESFAQRVEGSRLDLELTKELRLALRSPDPCRFRWRPVGLTSGVQIAAITMERSPLQFRLHAGTEGALFEAEAPHFTAEVENITASPQSYRLGAYVGGEQVAEIKGQAAAGETRREKLTLPDVASGHYELEVRLYREGSSEPLLVRATTFGRLPEDRRQYRAESPFGTWDFNGGHFTPFDAYDQLGPLYRKLGLRYGMFAATPEERERFGVLKGNEYAVREGDGDKALAGYRKWMEQHPDALPSVLLFHENSISGEHVTRVPDLFHDRAPYELNEKEKARFAEMVATASSAVRTLREHYPEIKFSLGNGPIPLREEFYRSGYSPELFDFGGNEAGVFGRPPETQPPDIVSNNASIWMDRQLLDAYGYHKTPVVQCYEVIYPGTNPGNLSYQTQADYFVRHLLHSMSWGIPKIRPGCIADAGNSYYYSNWGSTGFFTGRPILEPKPAALAMATLSHVLDGASFESSVETGSDGAYLLSFRKKDQRQVLVYWVVRGERELQVSLEGKAGEVELISGEGKSETRKEGILSLTATATAAYALLPEGATIKSVTLGTPKHEAQPNGKVEEINALASLEDWEIIDDRNGELEAYNPLTPRRKGNFRFEAVETEAGAALRVTPLPVEGGKPTMPMVVELRHRSGIPLKGKPTEIGLWVNGNSGWGRLIFELEDASGQRWTSIGAKAAEQSAWMADWLPEEVQEGYTPGEIADWNTDDVYGESRITFDGWRYVSFPLPGQYPGEGFHWPGNSQWKSTGDGTVHYPLRLTKVIVELPEKVLHLQRFAPPQKPSIEIRRLVTAEDPAFEAPKQAAGEYVEAVQKEMR